MSRDDAIKGAFREWQAGDDLSLERLMGERQRAGLDPKPEHPEYKTMRAGAVAEGWKPGGKKAMTVAQASAALMHELKRRGWKPDTHASTSLRVWISPDTQRRMLFGAKSVRWETGGRGRWEKDYAIHTHGDTMSVIDFVQRLMLKKAAKPLTREEWTDPMQNPSPDERRRSAQRSGDLAAQLLEGKRAGRRVSDVRAFRVRNSHNTEGGFDVDLTVSVYGVSHSGGVTLVLSDFDRSPVPAGNHVEGWVDSGTIAWLDRVVGVLNETDPGHGEKVIAGVLLADLQDGAAEAVESWLRDGGVVVDRTSMNPGGGRPMQNPPDKDVLFSLASLAQHGRTSTTLPALVALTGRPQAHVEAVVAALAQRGVVNVRGPLVIFDRRIVALVAGGPGVARKANPSPDERRRALQRQAQREAETYGEAATDTTAALQHDQARVSVPTLGDRAYLRDILAAWGVGEHGDGNYVSVGVASKALQAVFKKAKIKAEFRSASYSGGSHISITSTNDADKMKRLFGVEDRGVFGGANISVYPNAREDKSDSMSDYYYSPGGVTLPAEYYQTYAESVQKALGSKDTTTKKKADKLLTKSAERSSAIVLDETYGAPVNGKRYYFDMSGRMGGVWQAGSDMEVAGRGRIYEFTRVGKRGEMLNALSGNNHLWLSWNEWARALKSKIIKYGPTSNPGMATLGWATNPGGLTLAQARKRIGFVDLRTLVAQTRPRDRDKLKAEIAHAARGKSSNPGQGRQKGGAWKTISWETAIGRYGIDKLPGFKAQLAHYRKFHKADPHSVKVCVRQNADGRDRKLVVTDMGEVPETQYVVKDGKDSNKAGHHWVHKHREKGRGANPTLVFDAASGTMMIVGGTYKVTDWIRN